MSSLSKRGQKIQNGRGERIFDAVADFAIFRDRISNFSLKYWAIRPSEVFGARRKATLRGEAYAWTPVLGVFDKLRDVGVSPYLGFTLYLSLLQCFSWIEALNGHLIGPKTWDRSVRILWNLKWTARAVHGLFVLCMLEIMYSMVLWYV